MSTNDTHVYAGIHDLPNEILGAIFALGHNAYLEDRRLGHATTSPPFECVASQVCRHWRYFTIGYPLLWSSFWVGLDSRSLKRLPVYLERSAANPLELDCDFRTKRLTQSLAHDSKLVSALRSLIGHQDRWRRLSLQCSSDSDAGVVIEALKDVYVPILETVEITVPCHEQTYHGPTMHLFRKGAPSLKTFRVAGFAFSQCQVPLQTIQRLDFTVWGRKRMIYFMYINMLRESHSLEHLSLTAAVDGWPRHAHEQRIASVVLPQLKSLELQDGNWVLWRYLTSIQAPSLLSLTLHDVVEDDFLERHIISSNFPILQCLNLVSPYYTLHSLRSVSESFPTVRHLSITQADPECLSELLGDLGHEALWPQLATITLAPPPRSLETLLKLVAHRIAEKSPLKAVVIPHPDEIPGIEDLYQMVQVLPYTGEPLKAYQV
ncbi:hypothetical protein AX16_008859 [Volvariella volvacea WC 439]|nr:hypothetical protein AX16_008859 [Volvariella volvacea WC 439]